MIVDIARRQCRVLRRRHTLRPDGCPITVNWRYDRAEILADGIVHVIGLGIALAGVIALIVVYYPISYNLKTASVVIYALGLLAMLAFSAAYNMWPISPRKWWLRRCDHSAIFLFIAATYTPLIAQMGYEKTTIALLVGIWSVAAFGIGLKCLFPGRFDRLSIALCLVLGASGMLAHEAVVAALPKSTLLLVIIGGVFYSVGIIFHLWERLRFQNAIWHSFVVVAACCHYAAIMNFVILAA